ncbi:hypothetical protein VNO77_19779 [Canavalia gladiata]|uniref:Uncharacterized protein n=1 Tax=Canavalia gladiata TaxID=3824 RepID=A0AAN9LRX7_CANGL
MAPNVMGVNSACFLACRVSRICHHFARFSTTELAFPPGTTIARSGRGWSSYGGVDSIAKVARPTNPALLHL